MPKGKSRFTDINLSSSSSSSWSSEEDIPKKPLNKVAKKKVVQKPEKVKKQVTTYDKKSKKHIVEKDIIRERIVAAREAKRGKGSSRKKPEVDTKVLSKGL